MKLSRKLGKWFKVQFSGRFKNFIGNEMGAHDLSISGITRLIQKILIIMFDYFSRTTQLFCFSC